MVVVRRQRNKDKKNIYPYLVSTVRDMFDIFICSNLIGSACRSNHLAKHSITLIPILYVVIVISPFRSGTQKALKNMLGNAAEIISASLRKSNFHSSCLKIISYSAYRR